MFFQVIKNVNLIFINHKVMKYTKLLFSIIFIFSVSQINAQTTKEITQERINNKVKLFSDEEFANLQSWYYEEVQKMEMTQDVETKYTSVLNMHLSKMSRLDDKDKGYSKDEQIEKFNASMNKLNADMKSILNEKQYKQHLSIMETASDAILKKLKLKN